MAHILSPILAACLLASAPGPADAAMGTVRVPTRFDGSWRIVASTAQGPCPASASYQVQISGTRASVPNQDIGIAGGVSARGAVRATITQGSNRVPITGRLDPEGSGSGSWRTSGGLVACSGSWSAKRSG